MKSWRVGAMALAVAVVGLAVIVCVQAAMLHGRGWRVDWGTFPDWISALGGLATVGALFVAWLVYRHDVAGRREDERRRLAAERRRQAELITGWFVHLGSARYVTPIPFGQQVNVPIWDQPQKVVNHAQVGLLNASEVLIYDVIVAAVCKPGDALPARSSTGEINLTEHVEWDEGRAKLACGRASVLPPGQWSTELRLATASLLPEHLHLFYRDHRGVYWWRDAGGNLTEQPPPDDREGPADRIRQIAQVLGVQTNGRVAVLVVKPLTVDRAT